MEVGRRRRTRLRHYRTGIETVARLPRPANSAVTNRGDFFPGRVANRCAPRHSTAVASSTAVLFFPRAKRTPGVTGRPMTPGVRVNREGLAEELLDRPP